MLTENCEFRKTEDNSNEVDFNEPTHNRLAYTHTLESTRNKNSHFDCEAPSDLLERRLRSVYDQHADWNRDNAHTVLQPETCNDGHGRILLNRIQDAIFPENPPERPFTYWQLQQKNHPLKNNNTITGVHLQESNRGYARQPHGGFYKY
ncbi:unnamed protein product [Hymenolepis diminuta]|uniref:Uncharacterized protein n=1 Tax=Hymenolepis diminuta TaxID=6216 RepID=A0A564YDF8_HYMDI|nr:unnamed protein product [Hymenolepis diminuta]